MFYVDHCQLGSSQAPLDGAMEQAQDAVATPVATQAKPCSTSGGKGGPRPKGSTPLPLVTTADFPNDSPAVANPHPVAPSSKPDMGVRKSPSRDQVSKDTRVSDLWTQQPAMDPLAATLFEQCMSQLTAVKATAPSPVKKPDPPPSSLMPISDVSLDTIARQPLPVKGGVEHKGRSKVTATVEKHPAGVKRSLEEN